MKKYLLSALLILLCFSVRASGGDKYTEAMQGALSAMKDAKTLEDMQNISNRFERIGNAEKKEWLPFYYASLCHTLMSYLETDNGQKDALLDKAEEFQKKAAEMKVSDTEKAELTLLKGMIYGSRIQVDPQTRGMQFGPLSSQMYGRAMAQDPKNPRALYLQGQSLMYTPEMFGGGREKAIPMLEEAVQKFDAWESPSEIHPTWGKEDAEKLLAFAKSGEKAPWEEEMEKGMEEQQQNSPEEGEGDQ